MTLNDFNYDLPEELIAQTPADKRENSRMLVLDKGRISHKHFYDIVDLLDNDTLLVLNNTKVIPARLFAKKETGAKIEVFLVSPSPQPLSHTGERGNKIWHALIKPSKRVKPGMILTVSPELQVKTLEQLEDRWIVELIYEGNIYDVLQRNGHIPLPPYIARKAGVQDIERYQTVYAQKEGSVAAPTAGLHFTQDILDKLKTKGVEIAYVTLNVGLGTFRPVKCENILEHKMDSETFEISEETAQAINSGKKIVAVGTTTVRTLETAFRKYGKIQACRDSSELFIYPPYEFKVVNGLITNFHLPKSTLLMLVSALAGRENIVKAYEEAVREKYRFYSYGDCMFIK
ncbi:MAG: tRNA preQ1(34) S-adenosylmethionine ribosyltransferase-isomerase QueA [Heliobacteriaceae bacterium]|nr:tRNA preQ1(34) S-adenosylmethionine ribosyltransferase-isomerase QueA [Heliobacteriaceae bacterium]